MKYTSYHPSLIPLSLVQIVNILGISLLIPVLPTITNQFWGWYFLYGVLLSIYAFFQFFAAPLWWSLSDKYGRKRILLISQWWTLMSWVIFGAAWFVPMEYSFLWMSASLWIILVARIFDGITAGNNSVINAYIADISPTKEEKVKYFGIMAAMMGVGVMLGPLLGWLSAGFSSWGNFGTIIGAAFLSLVTFVILWITLPESPKKNTQTKQLISVKEFLHTINIPRDLITIWQSDSRMGTLWLLIGVFSSLFLGYTTIYVLHATGILWLSIVQIGLVGTMVGLVFAINQIFIVPRVSHFFGPYHILLLWHIMMVFGLGAMTYATGVMSFLLLSIILASGIAWCMTLFNTIVASSATDNNEWYLLGLKESVNAAASIIAPLIGAWLYALFSQEIFIIYAVVASLMVVVIFSQLHYDKTLDT